MTATVIKNEIAAIIIEYLENCEDLKFSEWNVLIE